MSNLSTTFPVRRLACGEVPMPLYLDPPTEEELNVLRLVVDPEGIFMKYQAQKRQGGE